MSAKFKRKGYFFIIDSLIAMTILTVGFFILISFFITSPPKNQATTLNYDIMSFLTTTHMKDYTESTASINRSELLLRGSLDNTISEQILEFWYLEGFNCISPNSNATSLVRDVVANVVPVQYDVLIRLGDCNIYERSIASYHEADLLIPSKTYIMTIYNNNVIVGPYLLEVFVWQ